MSKIQDINCQDNRFLPFWLWTVFVILLIIASIIGGGLFGSADIAFADILKVFKLKLFGINDESLQISSVFIIWDLRIPRAILALAAGGGLAICGASLQSITQNVLANPYILGISSGASAAVSLAMFLGIAGMASTISIPIIAFIGAMLSLLLVYKIGIAGRSGSSIRLILAGTAISVVFNAFSSLFIMITPSDKVLRSFMAWTMGSLAGARWNNLLIPVVSSVLGSLIFLLYSRAFNVISLGDETAISLGINTNKIKKMTSVLTAFITGVMVAFCGIIGFVGFIIPHIVRLIIGPDHRKLFPLSFLVGGLFLLWIDIIARVIMAPQELPIGIFTALAGGPIFIWLLTKQIK
ncbi:MAG: ABC transporter permease [Treponema sp.]|nr:MAG: ABC transporter permease [Treponema sp.]